MIMLKSIKFHASAFGVAACVGLLFWMLLPKASDQNKTEQNIVSSSGIVQEGRSVSLTPSEIMEKVKTIAEPSLREKTVQVYVGAEVEWNLYLNNISKQNQNDVHLVFADNKDIPHNTLVGCLVSLNDNKILKIIEEGILLNVIGQISKITPSIPKMYWRC